MTQGHLPIETGKPGGVILLRCAGLQRICSRLPEGNTGSRTEHSRNNRNEPQNEYAQHRP
jgi:hypothetical protein